MKNIKFHFHNFVYTLFVCLLIASLSIATGNWGFAIAAAVLFALACVPATNVYFPQGSLHSEVIRRIFSSELQKNLYPANEFYKTSKVDAGLGITATVVEIPQAGLPPTVIVNPEVRPIPARVRKDDKKVYEVNLYETQPDIVSDLNQAVVSYDKRAAVLEDHVNSLNTRIASEIAVAWSPTKSYALILTTGANGTGTKLAGMTGSRKEVTYQDFINLATLLDNQNVPDDGQRNILIHPSQVAELKKIAEFRDFDKTGIQGQFASGAIGKIQNFNVYKRTTVPIYALNSTTGAKAVNAVIGATDNLAILAWHPSYVRRAEGIAQVNYSGITQPGYGGPTFNAAVVGGGTISRNDEVGVAVLVQGQ